MGLDWIPGAKPKPGCEAAFLALWRKLEPYDDTKKYDPADWKRLNEMMVSPYETLDAPPHRV